MFNEVEKPRIVLLAAWQLSDPNFWLQKELESLGFDVTVLDIPDYKLENRQIKWREILLWIDYLKLALQGIRVAKQADGTVVLACHFLVGVFVSLLSAPMSLEKRQPTIALNMIVREKGIFNQILRRFVYQTAFLSDQLLLTVNSPELRDRYIESFGIKPENIFVVRECWDPKYKTSSATPRDGEFVFSGGEANRDWNTLLSVASACPEIPFKIAARRITWSPQRDVPANVDVVFDTDVAEFYAMVANSRLILLPLFSQATAGLLVLTRAILMGKLAIVTDTPATVAFYPSHCRDLLVPEADAELMTSRLKYYWANHECQIQKAMEVQNHVLQNLSPSAYANQVSELVNRL
jgi:hypothetical protein